MLCEWLEGEGEFYSISELHDKMKELGQSDSVYSPKWLKKKLQMKYGDMIFISEIEGKSDVVCFKESASFLIDDQWYQSRKENIEDEREAGSKNNSRPNSSS